MKPGLKTPSAHGKLLPHTKSKFPYIFLGPQVEFLLPTLKSVAFLWCQLSVWFYYQPAAQQGAQHQCVAVVSATCPRCPGLQGPLWFWAWGTWPTFLRAQLYV